MISVKVNGDGTATVSVNGKEGVVQITPRYPEEGYVSDYLEAGGFFYLVDEYPLGGYSLVEAERPDESGWIIFHWE